MEQSATGNINPEPVVVPAVREWQGATGRCSVSAAVIAVSTVDEPLLGPVAAVFAEDLEAATGSRVPVQFSSDGQTSLSEIMLKLDADSTIPTEGYRLDISSQVTITGSTPIGVFYGTRTLLQLLTQDSSSLPQGKITDHPEHRLRSILLDVGRKFIPFEELRDWVVALSYFKMNEIHLHLNDNAMSGNYGGFRVELKSIPGLSSKDGCYAQAELRELQDFAAIRGVRIVPEIDTPGHSRAITMARPDLAHPVLGGDYLDITNPDTLRFVEQVFDEVIGLFDADHVHIGTDEYQLEAISDPGEREVLGELFRQYINQLSSYIRNQHGRTVRIWSGYEDMPGSTEPDKSIVIDMWVSGDAVNKTAAGYDVINSTHLWTYIVPGANYYGVDNRFLYGEWTPLRFADEPGGTLKPGNKQLLGGKLHVWNDLGPTGYTTKEIARLAMPSAVVMSEKLWGTKGAAEFAGFAARVGAVLPGTDGFEMVPHTRSAHDPQNVQAGRIPNTSFMSRGSASNSGQVWEQRTVPQHFTGNTYVELELGTDNLEYPWTASFTLTRTSDSNSGNEILLSSELAAIYLDYPFIAENSDTENSTGVRQGVACVRANYAPCATPAGHTRPDILFFDFQVPLGSQVTLTLIGMQNRTELHVDGKLAGSVDLQMVCPLRWLGDGLSRRSFAGILHSAVIRDDLPEGQ